MLNSIIHLNIADFAVAVERNITPGLRSQPLIVAPEGAPRAVVYDMSEEAFQDGVRKGMPLRKAIRLSRGATILPPCFNRYERAMKDLIKRALAYSPLIESGRDDGHLFIDATGTSRLFGPPVDVAWRLNREMKKDFCLDPVWSVASNKLVAKVATRIAKPVGEYIVASGDESAFLAPLPLRLIPGLSKNDLIRLREFNFFQVSQVRRLNMEQLAIVFQHRALLIYETIRGIDRTKILPVSDQQNLLQADYEFADDTNNTLSLKKALYILTECVCKQLRNHQMQGVAMKMVISYSDGLQRSAHIRISPPTSNDIRMFKKCIPLLYKAWTRRVRIRHICLRCEKTIRSQTQMELFENKGKPARQDKIISTMEAIRKKFGPHALTSGTTMFS